jgi:hypothetical protein
MYMGRFMVSSVDKELLGIQQLIRVQNNCNFDGTRTAINEIPIKQIEMLLARVAVQLEDFQELE